VLGVQLVKQVLVTKLNVQLLVKFKQMQLLVMPTPPLLMEELVSGVQILEKVQHQMVDAEDILIILVTVKTCQKIIVILNLVVNGAKLLVEISVNV
jgi:hypothetical protein